MTAFLTIFRKLPNTFWRFPKILQNLFEGHTNVSKHFPKITEDCWRLSRKTRRCFDDTPTNLSTIKETNLISVKSSISSLVRTDMENTPPESRMCFVWILRVAYSGVHMINRNKIPWCCFQERKLLLFYSHTLQYVVPLLLHCTKLGLLPIVD